MGRPVEPVLSGWHDSMGCNKWGPTPRVLVAGLVEGPFFACGRRGLSVVLLVLILNVLQASYVSLTNQYTASILIWFKL